MPAPSFAALYLSRFGEALQTFEVTDHQGAAVPFDRAVERVRDQLAALRKSGRQVMMVGNGGSAGICSHQAVDYWKNGGIRATAFNDASLLTCISNDYSYAEVFSKPIQRFGEAGDLLYCISSSGRSDNIRNAAKAGRERQCGVITFSGFEPDNPLRAMGDLNFYVRSRSYGFVEILHLLVIHCILDAHLYETDKVDVFEKNRQM
jgi:D-sedoheptulose 7-phosphate isomerase